MNNKKIPVILITGYLGSGKTTLMQNLLKQEKRNIALIVNDMGSVNIDAALLNKNRERVSSVEMVELQDGCICCSLRDEFIAEIERISKLPDIEAVFVEASGISEPSNIAASFVIYTEDNPDTNVYLSSVVSVVDADRIYNEFLREISMENDTEEGDIINLIIDQIEFCNLIILNKASEVSKEDLGRIRSVITHLQPHARIVECDYGDVDFDDLLHTGLFDFEKVATSAAWIEALEGHDDDDEDDDDDDEHEHHHDHDHDEEHEHHHHDDDDDEHEHHHHHHHHHHGEGEVEEYGIGTFVWQRRAPMDLGRFDHFVARLWPKSIIRCKGICYFKSERDTCYLFEQAGRQVQLKNAGLWYATMPEDELEALMQRQPDLRRDWDEYYGDRMQKLVFIGQHLDKEAITTLLDQCLVEE